MALQSQRACQGNLRCWEANNMPWAVNTDLSRVCTEKCTENDTAVRRNYTASLCMAVNRAQPLARRCSRHSACVTREHHSSEGNHMSFKVLGAACAAAFLLLAGCSNMGNMGSGSGGGSSSAGSSGNYPAGSTATPSGRSPGQGAGTSGTATNDANTMKRERQQQ